VIKELEELGLPVEAVVEEPVGGVERTVPLRRGDHPVDAHAVVEDAVQDVSADGVVVEGRRFDVGRGGTEGLAAATPGPVLAVGDVKPVGAVSKAPKSQSLLILSGSY
jgi:hypothetical protein